MVEVFAPLLTKEEIPCVAQHTCRVKHPRPRCCCPLLQRSSNERLHRGDVGREKGESCGGEGPTIQVVLATNLSQTPILALTSPRAVTIKTHSLILPVLEKKYQTLGPQTETDPSKQESCTNQRPPRTKNQEQARSSCEENSASPVLGQEVHPSVRHMAAPVPFLSPALFTAAAGGWLAEVRRLLADGADIEESGGPRECSPLHEAAFHGRQAVVLLLIEHGAQISAKAKGGVMPLGAAAFQGHEEVVLLLLEHGAEVSAKANAGVMAIHCGAVQGHEAMVTLLLDKGAPVSAKNDAGATPLHWCALQGHAGMALLLLNNEADVASQANDEKKHSYIGLGVTLRLSACCSMRGRTCCRSQTRDRRRRTWRSLFALSRRGDAQGRGRAPGPVRGVCHGAARAAGGGVMGAMA